jgi:hypothetical protein
VINRLRKELIFLSITFIVTLVGFLVIVGYINFLGFPVVFEGSPTRKLDSKYWDLLSSECEAMDGRVIRASNGVESIIFSCVEDGVTLTLPLETLGGSKLDLPAYPGRVYDLREAWSTVLELDFVIPDDAVQGLIKSRGVVGDKYSFNVIPGVPYCISINATEGDVVATVFVKVWINGYEFMNNTFTVAVSEGDTFSSCIEPLLTFLSNLEEDKVKDDCFKPLKLLNGGNRVRLKALVALYIDSSSARSTAAIDLVVGSPYIHYFIIKK